MKSLNIKSFILSALIFQFAVLTTVCQNKKTEQVQPPAQPAKASPTADSKNGNLPKIVEFDKAQTFQINATDLPKPFATVLPKTMQFAGSALVVGPYRAVNFPWILLDRAVGAFCYVINRAHARREEVTLRGPALRAVMEKHAATSDRWSDADRKACEKIFSSIRRGKFTGEQRDELHDLIRQRLLEVSVQRMDFG